MKKYLAYTAKLAEATPASRNRIVDFWRVVAIVVVVFGHWLAASIWLKPNDEIELLNSLAWIPYAGWITWLVQVMPIFFGVPAWLHLTRASRGRCSRSLLSVA